MYTRAVLLSLLVAAAHARFGQEQVPIPAIAAVQGGAPGVAQTIAGAAVSDLLAAANPCDKLKRGDQILRELGTGADSIAAAKGIVAAEKNFNPFAADIPSICSDPTLPTSEVLRGITPLIDPAVGGSDLANQLSKESLTTPFDATGKSVADVLTANGFSNFTAVASDDSGPAETGTPVADSDAATETETESAAVSATEVASTTAAVAVADVSTIGCPPLTTFLVSTIAAAAAAATTGASTSTSTSTSSNINTFTGSLGSPPVAVSVISGDRPFSVNGDTFVNFAAACQRACDVQNNACADAANEGGNKQFSVADCNAQDGQCEDNCNTSAPGNVPGKKRRSAITVRRVEKRAVRWFV